jgi:DNA-binding transcriptional MerR regulator
MSSAKAVDVSVAEPKRINRRRRNGESRVLQKFDRLSVLVTDRLEELERRLSRLEGRVGRIDCGSEEVRDLLSDIRDHLRRIDDHLDSEAEAQEILRAMAEAPPLQYRH